MAALWVVTLVLFGAAFVECAKPKCLSALSGGRGQYVIVDDIQANSVLTACFENTITETGCVLNYFIRLSLINGVESRSRFLVSLYSRPGFREIRASRVAGLCSVLYCGCWICLRVRGCGTSNSYGQEGQLAGQLAPILP